MRNILDPFQCWIGFQTVSRSVTPPSGLPPVTTSEALTSVRGGAAQNVDVLANDVDPEGGALTLVSAVANRGDARAEPDGTLTYTPPAGAGTADAVTYVVEDEDGMQSEGTLQVTVMDPVLSIGELPGNSVSIDAATGNVRILVTAPAALSGNYLVDPSALSTGPINLVRPAISGQATIGAELTASEGLWVHDAGSLPAGIAISHQWLRDGGDIPGATAPTYVIDPGDDGANIGVEEVATAASGSVSAISDSILVVARTLEITTEADNTFTVEHSGPDTVLVTVTEPVAYAGTYPLNPADLTTGPVNLVPASIGGTTNLGDTLTVVPGIWIYDADANPNGITVDGQWRSDTVDISGETGLTYVITSSEQDTDVDYEETATGDNGTRTVDSNDIAVPAAPSADFEDDFAVPPHTAGTDVHLSLGADYGKLNNSITPDVVTGGGALQGHDAASAAQIVDPAVTGDNYEVRLDVDHTSGSISFAAAFIWLRSTKGATDTDEDGYRIQFNDRDSKIKLWWVDGGASTTLIDEAHTYPGGGTYEVSAKIVGDTITCFVDSVEIASYTHASNDKITTGGVGIGVFDSNSKISNLRVWNLDPPAAPDFYDDFSSYSVGEYPGTETPASYSNFGTGMEIKAAGELGGDGVDNQTIIIDPAITGDDYEVVCQVDMDMANASNNMWIIVRYDEAADNGHRCNFLEKDNLVYFRQRDAGANGTVHVNTACTYHSSGLIQIKIRVEGTRYRGYVDGVEYFDETIAAYPTGSKIMLGSAISTSRFLDVAVYNL